MGKAILRKIFQELGGTEYPSVDCIPRPEGILRLHEASPGGKSFLEFSDVAQTSVIFSIIGYPPDDAQKRIVSVNFPEPIRPETENLFDFYVLILCRISNLLKEKPGRIIPFRPPG